jgi:hypothetical protein
MAGPAPKTKNWIARENAHKPKGLHIIVSGQVELTNANLAPRLTESAERNPKHLGLTLSIEKCRDPGVAVRLWKNALFHKEVKANQYDSVTVRWDGTSIAQFPVIDDREYYAKLVQQTKVLNAKHQGKAGPKPAGKPAAKRQRPGKRQRRRRKRRQSAAGRKARRPRRKLPGSRRKRPPKNPR